MADNRETRRMVKESVKYRSQKRDTAPLRSLCHVRQNEEPRDGGGKEQAYKVNERVSKRERERAKDDERELWYTSPRRQLLLVE